MNTRGNRSALGSRCAATIAALIAAWFLTSPTAAQCQRWVQATPDGGDIWSLAIDPVTPSTLYAGTDGALYRSTDRGANWTAVNTGSVGEVVYSVVIDPATPSTVYAGISPGVYRSTDRGEHWTVLNTGLTDRSVNLLAIDPVTPSTLYAATFYSLYRSTDRGDHWSEVRNGLTDNDVWSLAIDPRTPSTLYAGTRSGVYRSTDRGDNWTPVNNGLTELNVYSLAIDPETPSSLFAGTRTALFRSTDQGNQWTFVTGLPINVDVSSLAIDHSTPSNVYLGTSRGAYRSTDGGFTWKTINAGGPYYLTYREVNSVVIDPVTPSTLYAGTRGSGVFRSTDRGDLWTPVNSGLKAPNVLSIAVDPTAPSTIYLGTYDMSLFRSGDRGVNWMPATTDLGVGAADPSRLDVHTIVIEPSAPFRVWVGTGYGVYFSTNRGTNWTQANSGLTDRRVLSLAIDPAATSSLYVGTVSAGVFRSTDRGGSWTAINKGLTNLEVRSLAIDPLSPSTLYAGTREAGIFRSTDQGANWTPINNGLTNLEVFSLAIDPVTPSPVYAGTYGGGVFRSTDLGNTWSPANSGLTNLGIRILVIDPATHATLYAGTGGSGVFRSTDRGANWSALNSGLTNFNVYSLAIDPTDPSTLYVGTFGAGVWRMQLQCALRFSQFGKGLGLASDIVLTNPSASATISGTVAAADDSGLPLSIPFGGIAGNQFSIPPRGALTLSTASSGELVIGSAVLTTDSKLGGLVRFTIPGIGTAGVAAGEPTSRFIAPVRRVPTGLNTGVALYSPEVHALTLDLSLRDRQGQELAGGRRMIENFPARGHMARFINELFPEANADNFEGTLVVKTSVGQIVAAVLEFGAEPGEFTALPVTPLTTLGTSSKLSFAQFGNGQGLTSDTVLVNPRAEASVSGTLTFFNEEGQPLPVGLVGSGQQSSVPFSIPPLAEVTISTDGLGPLAVGSARATADGPLAGVVRYHISGVGTAGVGESRAFSAVVIPVRETTTGIRSAIALQNTGDAAVSVTLTLRDASGALVPAGISSINSLPARGHHARFLEELFPEAQIQDFRGTIWVEVTGGTVAATAFEIGSNPGEFTTLTVTPVQ